MNKYNQIEFATSAPSIAAAPKDSCAEVAFVGRSNAGKSSALNIITGVKNLAKTSKTPGRTQLINFFALKDNKYLVDLPGYGYAKVARKTQQEWEQNLAEYLLMRGQLQGVVIIMDIRHPLKELDQNMLGWLIENNLPTHILLTKADKLTRNQAHQALMQVNNAYQGYAYLVSAQIFSAFNGTGVEAARNVLDKMLA